MDVRAHLAGMDREPVEPDQYVKTGSLVSPELIQYLDKRYPDTLSHINFSYASHADIAFEAGAAHVVAHLKVLMQAAADERKGRILRALPQVD